MLINHNLRAIIFAYVGANKARDFASINSNNRELIGKYLYIVSLGKTDIEKLLLVLSKTPSPPKPTQSLLSLYLKNPYLRPKNLKVGGYALHFATKMNNPEVVEILLKDGRANPNITIKDHVYGTSQRLLSYASQHGRLDIVKLLLADPRIKPAENHNHALERAILSGHVDIARLLLADPRVGVRYGSNDNPILPIASRFGHAEIVKLCLADPRINPAENFNEAIGIASDSGHLEIVKLLLADARVNPSDSRNWALHNASLGGHTAIVDILLQDTRMSISPYRYNDIVHRASLNGHTEVVKLLLADMKLKTTRRAHPYLNSLMDESLRIASQKGNIELVKWLLADSHVNPTAGKYNRKKEPIALAYEGGYLEVVKVLYADQRVYRSLSREMRAKYRPVPLPPL